MLISVETENFCTEISQSSITVHAKYHRGYSDIL
jgi:hypothetical protein